MKPIFESSATIGAKLLELKQTISVAESSTGGFISANLLCVAGASAFFVGGSVVYSLRSRREFLDLDRARVKDLKPLSEEMVLEFARAARAKLDTTWGVAELGAAGPAPTPYGHAAGTSVIGISGPVELTCKIETGSSDREANMLMFTEAALDLFYKALVSGSVEF
jgi:PncC family amidohydrolase|tara:strand:- start:1107 stop:1604 length:498 start_codon:yes stop_codon:yes gene_type:complete